MGQKVHPLGFRIGVSKEHNSFWYSKSREYFLFVREDIFVRKFFSEKLLDVCISHIEIKRKLNYLIVNIFLGKSGMGSLVNSNKIFSLRSELSILLSSKFAKRELTINLVEVVDPDTNSKFLSEFVKEQLERRVPFRKVIKSTLLKAQKAGVKGVKVQISGRLNGAEIARTEWVREGQVPLHNLKANIDYFNNTAQTLYGTLGIKIWVYKIL